MPWCFGISSEDQCIIKQKQSCKSNVSVAEAISIIPKAKKLCNHVFIQQLLLQTHCCIFAHQYSFVEIKCIQFSFLGIVFQNEFENTVVKIVHVHLI